MLLSYECRRGRRARSRAALSAALTARRTTRFAATDRVRLSPIARSCRAVPALSQSHSNGSSSSLTAKVEQHVKLTLTVRHGCEESEWPSSSITNWTLLPWLFKCAWWNSKWPRGAKWPALCWHMCRVMITTVNDFIIHEFDFFRWRIVFINLSIKCLKCHAVSTRYLNTTQRDGYWATESQWNEKHNLQTNTYVRFMFSIQTNA